MAFINSEAIRTVIVERLEGALDGVRAIDPDEAENDLFDGAKDDTKAVRALVRPIFSVNIEEVRKHPSSPIGPTSLLLYDVRIKIRIAYNLQGPQLNAVDYDDRKAVAEDQIDKFAQSLTWPGALDTCQRMNRSTGIVSGVLIPQDPLYRVTRDDPEAALFEVEHFYSAVVRVDAAIS